MSVTLKAIAEAAGVSIRSVTRALKNEPGGNPETTARIQALARELGYIPNMAARNLRLQRNNFVGMVLPPVSVAMTVRKTSAMQSRLEAAGFYPISALLPATAGELRKMLQDWLGLIDTVIFNAWNPAWNPADLLAGLSLQVVLVDIESERLFPQAADIEIDRESGIRDGIARLIRSGRQHVVQCGTRLPSRLRGFAAALQECGLSPDDSRLIETGSLEYESGYQVAPQILEHGDAVFFHTDRLALGFLKYCYEHRVAVPQQVAVVGFDDDPTDQFTAPSLSSVAQPVDAMAEKVVELVKPGGFVPGRTMFPTRFVARESI